MKIKKHSDLESDLKGIPTDIACIIYHLIRKSYKKRIQARYLLVRKGKPILPIMYNILKSKNEQLRREAAKIVELIGENSSIPVFIELLNDDDASIRWIASEGLIKMGDEAIVPLLNAIIHKDTYYIRMGAHHVFTRILNEKQKEEMKSLLRSLKGYMEIGETSPVEAMKLLRLMKRENRERKVVKKWSFIS